MTASPAPWNPASSNRANDGDSILSTASVPVPLFLVARLLEAFTSSTIFAWLASGIAIVGILFAGFAMQELWAMGARGRVAAGVLGVLTLVFAANLWL